jgi:hypothetical protein
MTEVGSLFARRIVGADRSEGMMASFATRFPAAEAITLDTESLVRFLLSRGETGGFDVITAFWSLSYPILECFESLDESGVSSAGPVAEATGRVDAMLTGLLSLLAPDGTLLGFFFDADRPEQRLVTRLWERVHPFPGTGRAFTFELLSEALRRAENDGLGLLRSTRIPGVVVVSSADRGLRWFTVGHLNSFEPLVSDPVTTSAIYNFLEGCERDGAAFLIPSGVHVFQFCRTPSRRNLLPA